jgi:hypothetical protein
MAEQQATTGNFRYVGIPAATVTWTDPNDDAGSVTCTIFSEISKSSFAGVDYEQVNNNAELTGLVSARRGFDLSFSCIPIGATTAAAGEVAESMPAINQELTITMTDDVQAAGKCYCKSASSRYTPDGDLVMDITARKYVAEGGGATAIDLGDVTYAS